MPEKELILTYEGLQKLEEELEYLKTTKKMEVAERIKEARGFGDLSENSEYDAAKNEQAEVEARIITIENMLRVAKVVSDDDVSIKTVGIGNKVKLLDVEENEELEYTIVGSTEVDLFNNKISNESPLGEALMGQKKGATVKVAAPMGEIEYKILKIEK
ncbi:MAG: transcription elongation factor GreA [Clostridiales bacterium]|nr:transcription elongation factor GreA [Clostridiales bacterium]